MENGFMIEELFGFTVIFFGDIGTDSSLQNKTLRSSFFGLILTSPRRGGDINGDESEDTEHEHTY